MRKDCLETNTGCNSQSTEVLFKVVENIRFLGLPDTN